MLTRRGETVILSDPVYIGSYAAVVGKLEGEGPLGNEFDMVFSDETLEEPSFEKAESKLQQLSVKTALEKHGMAPGQADIVLAGDLLNQCVGSAYGLRDFGIPFAGLYGACSTMALSVCLGSVLVASGAAKTAVAVTSSHFCSAERQFRFPLEYGGQRPQSAQWTVTGSGAAIIESRKSHIAIHSVRFGKIVDMGVTDMNNMGAAMAPAAADSILGYFADTGTTPEDFDLILTGDLGYVGSELLAKVTHAEGTDISEKHNDCGKMIFYKEKQDVHSGGSGCGCSASVLCSKIFRLLESGELGRVLFCATGALMSPTVSFQGESIPGIAHIVEFRHCK